MQLNNISEVLQKKFNENILKKNLLPEEVQLIVVGLSGGVDSVCLLDLLSNYLNYNKREIRVIIHHQDHQIRKDSQEDLELARKLSNQYNYEFAASVDNIPELSESTSKNMEEVGRDIRRKHWLEICKKYSSHNELHDCRILTAHHANDQAETLLLNLSRGSGLNGLSGIAYSDELFVRPLLNFTKEEIYNYAKENRLLWREDYTNTLNDNRRNFLRNDLIPRWEEATDNGLITRLSDAADKLAIANKFIKAECEKWMQELLISEPMEFTNQSYNLYSIRKFREVPFSLMKFLINEILKANGLEKDIYAINLEDIEDLLLQDKGEKELALSGNFTLVKNREYFYIYNGQEIYNQPNIRDNYKLSVRENLGVETNFYSNAEVNLDEYQIRTFNSGDYIIEDGKKFLLKEFFTQKNMRIELRKNILLIAKGNRVYVIGKNVVDNSDNPFYIAENTNDKGERSFKKSYYLCYMWYNS